METPNLVLLNFGAIQYIITGFAFVYAAYFFYVRPDGMLRRGLIGLFMSIAMGVISRGVWLLMELNSRVASNAHVSIFSISCVFAGIVGFIYVIKKMEKRERKG